MKILARIALTLYLGIFAAAVGIILVLNYETRTSFTWWWGRSSEGIPLVFLVLGGIVAGALYAGLLSAAEAARQGLRIRLLKRKLAAYELEKSRIVLPVEEEVFAEEEPLLDHPFGDAVEPTTPGAEEGQPAKELEGKDPPWTR
jgi:hypothetical protein